MKHQENKLVVPVTFESTPGWTFSPGNALWRIGEAHEGFGDTPPSVSCGNVTITASPGGHNFGDIACSVELSSGDAIDPPSHEDIELLRNWFGSEVADCMQNHENAVNGFKKICEVEPERVGNLHKLGRLAIIELPAISITSREELVSRAEELAKRNYLRLAQKNGDYVVFERTGDVFSARGYYSDGRAKNPNLDPEVVSRSDIIALIQNDVIDYIVASSPPEETFEPLPVSYIEIKPERRIASLEEIEKEIDDLSRGDEIEVVLQNGETAICKRDSVASRYPYRFVLLDPNNEAIERFDSPNPASLVKEVLKLDIKEAVVPEQRTKVTLEIEFMGKYKIENNQNLILANPGFEITVVREDGSVGTLTLIGPSPSPVGAYDFRDKDGIVKTYSASGVAQIFASSTRAVLPEKREPVTMPTLKPINEFAPVKKRRENSFVAQEGTAIDTTDKELIQQYAERVVTTPGAYYEYYNPDREVTIRVEVSKIFEENNEIEYKTTEIIGGEVFDVEFDIFDVENEKRFLIDNAIRIFIPASNSEPQPTLDTDAPKATKPARPTRTVERVRRREIIDLEQALANADKVLKPGTIITFANGTQRKILSVIKEDGAPDGSPDYVYVDKTAKENYFGGRVESEYDVDRLISTNTTDGKKTFRSLEFDETYQEAVPPPIEPDLTVVGTEPIFYKEEVNDPAEVKLIASEICSLPGSRIYYEGSNLYEYVEVGNVSTDAGGVQLIELRLKPRSDVRDRPLEISVTQFKQEFFGNIARATLARPITTELVSDKDGTDPIARKIRGLPVYIVGPASRLRVTEAERQQSSAYTNIPDNAVALFRYAQLSDRLAQAINEATEKAPAQPSVVSRGRMRKIVEIPPFKDSKLKGKVFERIGIDIPSELPNKPVKTDVLRLAIGERLRDCRFAESDTELVLEATIEGSEFIGGNKYITVAASEQIFRGDAAGTIFVEMLKDPIVLAALIQRATGSVKGGSSNSSRRAVLTIPISGGRVDVANITLGSRAKRPAISA